MKGLLKIIDLNNLKEITFISHRKKIVSKIRIKI